MAVFIYLAFYVSNLLFISRKKSDDVSAEYELLSEPRKRQITKFFYFYLTTSVVLIILVTGFTAYYKHKYGNYDL